VYPALAVIRALANENEGSDLEVLFVGSKEGMESQLIAQANLQFTGISAGGLRGVGLRQRLHHTLSLARGSIEAWNVLRRFRPSVVLATGGYVSAPVLLAARLQRIPALIYLPDIVPGLAVRVLAPLATRVAVTARRTAKAFGRKGIATGYPVRRELREIDREEARRRLGVAQDIPLVLVFGGSRGAHSINMAVAENLEALTSAAQILHICGPRDRAALLERRAALPKEQAARYRVESYLHKEMTWALVAADLAISRAGASVLGELPAARLPAILVPYPYAGRHQEDNARYLAEAGAAVMIDDDKLAAELAPTVTKLLTDTDRRRQMRSKLAALDRPHAAREIARLLVEIAVDRGGTSRCLE
jgi:UDP-N-acetylglucosamine--N-acetylmuramyl-(pentapeptide) pyrophosphoryl-undecaprenol N-acetylglucosamine transferase